MPFFYNFPVNDEYRFNYKIDVFFIIILFTDILKSDKIIYIISFGIRRVYETIKKIANNYG